MKDFESLQRFKYFGNMLGWAIQSHSYNLSMDLNPIIWKHLLDLPISRADISKIDKNRIDFLEHIENGNLDSFFVANLSTDCC